MTAPRITLLCYPRIFGYVFNPLTVYFCRDGEALRAILYEVHNTFGEKRTYVIRVAEGANAIEQTCAGLQRDGSPTAYLFCCRHCRALAVYMDSA